MKDKDTVVNEVAGSIPCSLKQMIEMGENKDNHGNFYWQNLYGAPLDFNSRSHANLMNDNPNFATTVKG